MADMRTALSGGYAEQMAPMIDPQGMAQNDPAQYYQKTPFMRSLWEGRLPTWLGQAYEQDIKPAWDAYEPKASDLYNAPMSMVGALGDDIANKTQSVMATDPNDPEALRQASQDSFDLAGYAAGGGFGASRLMGPKGDAILGANVWQGGPHKYGPEGASESLKHIGKGEGAQAYGWGRYDAENPDVAADYAKKLSKLDNIRPSAEVQSMYKQEWDDLLQEIRPVQNELSRYPDDARRAQLLKLNDDLMARQDAIHEKMISKTIDNMGGLEPNLYKHDLPDEDIARYLDWDKPLSEQPDHVKAVFKAVLPQGTYDSNLMQRTGAAMEDLWRFKGSKQAASEALAKAGIPGLKYLDGMSRNAGDGTRNYVTWDQDVLNRMKLLERNGESMTEALTGNK